MIRSISLAHPLIHFARNSRNERKTRGRRKNKCDDNPFITSCNYPNS